MRVLLIDDDDDVAAALTNALGSPHVVVRATNRDDALSLVTSTEHFDIAVCDLRMPSAPGQTNLSEEYGKEVFAEITVQRSGTPVWVCSGFADDDFTEALIRDPRSGDPFGERQTRPLVEKFRKIHLAKVASRLKKAAEALEALDTVEISAFGEQLHLSPEQTRLIQLAARQHDATLMRVRQLAGGMSGARTLAVEGIDVPGGGGRVMNCVLKIDTMDATSREALRYRDGVASVLPATAFAPLFNEIRAGAGNSSALVYSLAATEPITLASSLSRFPALGATIVDRLREQLSAWLSGRSAVAMDIGDLNTLLGAPSIEDAVANGFLSRSTGLSIAGSTVQVLPCVQHGDLHALNVLVDNENRPIVIDFARTTRRVASYDAVTLEFSLLFHPELAQMRGTWPTDDQLRNWDDLEAFVEGCPVNEFVSRCREWGRDVSLGDREYNAAVLAYALRQFRFGGEHNHSRLVARRAAELLAGS